MTATDDLVADLDRNRFVIGDQVITCTVDTFVAALQQLQSGTIAPGSLVPGEVLFADALGNVAQDTAFLWDSVNNRLGIGTVAATDAPLTVNMNTGAGAASTTPLAHFVAANNAVGNLVLDCYGANPQINGRRAQGTQAVPTAVAITNIMNSIIGSGYNGTAYIGGGSLRFVAAEAWAVGANGTTVQIFSTAPGTTGQVVSATFSPTLALFPGNIQTQTSTTVAALPAAAAGNKGTRTFVTDALVPVFGAAVAGGGAVFTPVYSDGATWLCG